MKIKKERFAHSHCLVAPSVLAMSLWPFLAIAQTPSPLPEWEYSAGVPLRQYFQPNPPEWQGEAGIGVDTQPQYDGSSRYEVLPAPSFDIRYYNLAFLSIGEGLGINILHGRTYRVGAAITYDLGRKLNYDFRFAVNTKVSPTAELKLFGEIVLFPVVLRADVRQAINGGYKGFVGDISAYMPVAGSRRHQYFILVGPAVTFASGQYMTKYFGVNALQARASGLPEFTAGGGIKQISFGVNATWFFGNSWFLNGVGAVDHLLGDAAQSPYTVETTQGTVSISVGYLFGSGI